MPLLFTGIRIAAVTVVATAPIAAIAGGGGLGDIIVNQASYRLEGVLGASFCVMALSAGVWVALLALQRAHNAQRASRRLGSRQPRITERSRCDRKHTRRAAKAAFAISFGVAIVLGRLRRHGAAGNRNAGPTIIIGTKNFPEEYILGELYKQALEAKGFTVSTRRTSARPR